MLTTQGHGRGIGDLTPARFTLPENTIGGARGMGDLTPARFTLPQNTLAMGGAAGMGGLGGLSDLGTALSSTYDSAVQWFQSQGTLVWVGMGAATLLMVYLLLGGSSGATSYRKELAVARRQIRAKYPRTGQRIYRAARAAVDSY